MKRRLCCLLAVWMCLLPLASLAVAPMMSLDEHTIHLASADVTFSAPASSVCLTRETSASVFGRYGLSQREVLAYMEAAYIYAMMFDSVSGDEYHILAFPVEEQTSLDELSEEEAAAQCESLRAELTTAGYTVEDADWYQSAVHAFMTAESSYLYEDGSIQWELLYETIQSGYNVQVRCMPMQGRITEVMRVTAQRIANSMSVTRSGLYSLEGDKAVASQMENDGTMIFTMPGLTITAEPLDPLYCATRESSEIVFGRIGYMYKKALSDMLAEDRYAIVTDSEWRVEIQVYLYGDDRAEDYAELTDAEIQELERNGSLERGWTVAESGVYLSGPWKFGKTTLSFMNEDGSESRCITNATCIDGYRIEVWAFPGEIKPMMLTLAAEAFMQNLTVEKTQE